MTVNHETCVIIAAFNEEKKILSTVSDLLSLGYIVLVVDDGSTDSTASLLKDKPILYYRHPTNLGQGAALQTGFSIAKYLSAKYFVTFDADGQHDPSDILKLATYLENNRLDIVFGSRFLDIKPKNLSLSRRILLKSAILVNYFFTGILLSDAHNGLRVMTKDIIGSISLKEPRMAYATELMDFVKQGGYKYGECSNCISYTDYSVRKGQKNHDAIGIFKNLLLSKIFRS